jgi:hypothetical protein
MMGKNMMFRKLLICGLALMMSSCLEGTTQVANTVKLLVTASDEERDQAVKSISKDDRAAIMVLAYGEDVVYISPQAEAAAFSSFNNFLWNVLGGFPPVYYQNVATPEQTAQLAAIQPIWQANLRMTKEAYADPLDGRLAAIDTRVQGNIHKMRDIDVRDLIWDATLYNHFMSDNDYAAGVYAESQENNEVLLGKTTPYVPEHVLAVKQQLLEVLNALSPAPSATTGS